MSTRGKMYYLIGTQDEADAWCRDKGLDVNDHRLVCVVSSLDDTRKLRENTLDQGKDEVVWMDGATWWDDDDRMRIDQQIRMMRNP